MDVIAPPPRKDVSPRNDLPVRRDLAPRKDLRRGSRPPPQNRPSTSSISVVFVMALATIAAFIASGSGTPVDPNGPGGPPTLQPYYNPADYPVQHIITPTGGFASNKQNLQLETFQVDNCGANTAILFLIDTSGSMTYEDKIGHEKDALNYFTSNMGGLSAVGIDTFGGETDVKGELPLSYVKDDKSQIQQVINGLTPSGGTPTRLGMQLAYNQLKQAISEEDFPGYKYNLVIITDGVPEKLPPRTCYPGTSFYDPRDAPLPRCFAQEEDPTVPSDISEEIRNLGADVYAINVYSPSWQSDAEEYPYLTTLLKKIVSPSVSDHYFVSVDGNNLKAVLQSIENNICYDDLDGTDPNTSPAAQ